jgi:hypothetical protein
MASKRKPRGRHNALRDGIFAQELVIANAGETQEEFGRLRSELVACFKPQDIAQEMLVEELLTSYWRLQRPRRCEAAEIRKQLETAAFRKTIERTAAVKTLKNRFYLDHLTELLQPHVKQFYLFAVDRSLEEARRALEGTSLGLEFLIERVEHLKKTLELSGYLPVNDETLLFHLCGLEDEHLHGFRGLNKLAKDELEKSKQREKGKKERDEKRTADKNADFNHAELHKMVLMMMLDSHIRSLNHMKKQLELLETIEDKSLPASLTLLPPESQDRIQRAEAALERRFYRALDPFVRTPPREIRPPVIVSVASMRTLIFCFAQLFYYYDLHTYSYTLPPTPDGK